MLRLVMEIIEMVCNLLLAHESFRRIGSSEKGGNKRCVWHFIWQHRRNYQ
jgi:hypothetical protein